jgi:methionyl-tRNA formyltransferase
VEVESKVKSQKSKVDFLLVVDFGYIVPNRLLELPTIAPVNIHPSELPKYRGSSPGQFALLFGEKKSAVSVIKMNNTVDQGDIIYQEKFDVLSTWTSTDYYHFAFELIAQKLPNILSQQPPTFIPQPIESPSPIARRLTKDDGYISWKLLQLLMTKNYKQIDDETARLLNQAFEHHHNWGETIRQATKAFSPWPMVWTIVPTVKSDKRMKILSIEKSTETIKLEKVQLEGLQPTTWNEIKKQIL